MFGDYVKVHKENVITNSMSPSTRPAICMGPTGSIQGWIKFMCIDTEKNVRRSYTRLPMPDSIIQKVEKLAERDSVENSINFKNRRKEIYDWENEECNIDDDRVKWKCLHTQKLLQNSQGQK